MKVLDKKLFRGIIGARGQTIAVAMVVLCGTASYIALAAAHRNLLLTRDTYYTEYEFADFEVMLERAPLTAALKLENLPGVRRVQGRIVEEVTLDLVGQEEPRIGRIISLPDRHEGVLNDIHLASGRYFDGEGANEVIISTTFADANHLTIGDRFKALIDNKKHSLRIIGTALSPEYVYMIRNAQEVVPNPERFGILWVSQSFAEMAFDMTGACNNIVGLVNAPDDLDEMLDRADRRLDPYGVFATVKREDQISHRFLSDEIKGLEVSARITPAIFLGIAALILMVMLNRMVRQERTQIGLLKASGYSNTAITSHYVKYALIITLIGCLGGCVVGQWLANAMIRMYVQFYKFPILRSRIYPDILARSMGIAIAFAIVGAVGAARKAAKIHPAMAMRPQTPKYAHRTALERATFIWRRLSFTWKMIIRNISRYRVRAGITAFGVMVSSGIMLIGFFSMDAVGYMLSFQYREIQKEDVKIALESERDRGALRDIARFDAVRRAEPLLQYPFKVSSEWRTKDVGIIGLTPGSQLMTLLDDQERPIVLGERGLVLSEKVAEDLGVKAGSVVTLKPLMGRVTKEVRVPVRQVARQYFGIGAYMDLEALSRILDEPFAMNAALVRTDPGAARKLSRDLKDIPGVAAVEIKEDTYANILATMAESMNISNSILAVFAGVIAFAIIYNATIVSLAERQRELASLRVMGFTAPEVASILYNENFLLSGLGLLLGFPFGLAMCKLLVKAYDTELYRMPFHIERRTLLLTGVLTIAFVILANLAARRKINRLDMVEVLKARE